MSTTQYLLVIGLLLLVYHESTVQVSPNGRRYAPPMGTLAGMAALILLVTAWGMWVWGMWDRWVI